MISRTKNRKPRQQVVRLVAECFRSGGEAPTVEAIEEITDGWFNAIYRVALSGGQKVVLKIAPRPDIEVMEYERGLMHTEVTCMRLVADDPSIPVPAILYFDDSLEVCDSPFFLMTELAGENFAKARSALDVVDTARIERQIGGLVRSINGYSGTFFGYQGNEDLRDDSWRGAFLKILSSVLRDAHRKGVAFDFAVFEIERAVRKHAEALLEVTEPKLVHWDLWDSNVLVEGGEITGIIDFERSLWGDPLMEAQFRPLNIRDGRNHYAQGYGKTELTAGEQQRSYLYLLHLGLVMHVECHFRQYATNEVSDLSKQLIHASMSWLQNN